LVQTPVRLAYLLRPTVALGVLLAIGFSTVAFVSTPFLLPELADHYAISLGAVSLVSVFQLGGFVLSAWAAGRWLRPRRRIFVVALAMSAVANLASAGLPPFPLLVALRLGSGVALGLVTWYGWVQAFGDDRRMGDVAVTGPLVGVIAAPLVAVIIHIGGAELTFAALAAFSLIPLAFGFHALDHDLPPHSARNPAVPAARVLLICLGMFTFGGSAVFQYAVVLGTRDPGLSAQAIAIGFSFNSLAGIPAARLQRLNGIPSPWMAATALCALVLATTSYPWLFLASLVFWGFSWWMATPAVFRVLASRSQYPEERAGDAQAVMAAGRSAGPFLGGVLIDGPGSTVLGLVGSALMLIAAAGVFTVRTTSPARTPI
jgi:DHA1 family inner membrane transport protein